LHAVLKAMLAALPIVTAMATLVRRITMPTRLVATGSPATCSEQDKNNNRCTRHLHARILLVAAWRARAQVAFLQPRKPATFGTYDPAQKALTLRPDPEPDLARRALAHSLLPSWLYREQMYR